MSDALVLHVPLAALPPVQLLEVHKVAHRLSVSPKYVWRLLRSKKLKAIRLGRRWRVDARDLEAYLAKCRDEAERA